MKHRNGYWLPWTPVGTYLGPLTYRQVVDRLGYDAYRHPLEHRRWEQRVRRAIAQDRIRLEYGEDLAQLLGEHPTSIWGLDYYTHAGITT